MHMAKKPQNKTKPQPVLHKMYWRIKGYSGFQCYKILLFFFFSRHILYFLSAIMSLNQRPTKQKQKHIFCKEVTGIHLLLVNWVHLRFNLHTKTDYMISARMTWKVKRWRRPERFLYFELSSLNLSWGKGLNIWLWKMRGGKRRSSWAKDKAGLHSRSRARVSSWGKERKKGAQAQSSQQDWGLQEHSQGSCCRQQAGPRTRRGKINSYGLARQMSYPPGPASYLHSTSMYTLHYCQ